MILIECWIRCKKSDQARGKMDVCDATRVESGDADGCKRTRAFV